MRRISRFYLKNSGSGENAGQQLSPQQTVTRKDGPQASYAANLHSEDSTVCRTLEKRKDICGQGGILAPVFDQLVDRESRAVGDTRTILLRQRVPRDLKCHAGRLERPN